MRTHVARIGTGPSGLLPGRRLTPATLLEEGAVEVPGNFGVGAHLRAVLGTIRPSSAPGVRA